MPDTPNWRRRTTPIFTPNTALAPTPPFPPSTLTPAVPKHRSSQLALASRLYLFAYDTNTLHRLPHDLLRVIDPTRDPRAAIAGPHITTIPTAIPITFPGTLTPTPHASAPALASAPATAATSRTPAVVARELQAKSRGGFEVLVAVRLARLRREERVEVVEGLLRAAVGQVRV